MRKGGHHLLCKQKREQFRFLRLYSCCVYKKKTTHFLKHHDYLKSIDTVIRIPGEVIRSYGHTGRITYIYALQIGHS